LGKKELIDAFSCSIGAAKEKVPGVEPGTVILYFQRELNGI
jgi:hypothetical protein